MVPPPPGRIAIVTETSPRIGSAVFRGLNHLDGLRRRAGRVDALMPDDVVPRHDLPLDRLSYFARHGVHYLRRTRELQRKLPDYDAVFVQRGAYPMGPSLVLRAALERFSGRVVFDLDDAVFTMHPGLLTRGRGARWLYGPQQARYLLDRADAVVVSTDVLADSLSGTRRPDAVLPTVPDFRGYPEVEQRTRPPIRVGWIGNAGNVSYLDVLAPVFRRLGEEGLVELEVVSPRSWDGPARSRVWRREDEPAVFGRWDVGIMPLPDTPYTRAKAGFKLLQYMGAGSAVVASPVGVNSWLVRESGAGVLADSPAEWERALRELAADPDRRRAMARSGRRWVHEYADLDHQAGVLFALLAG